MPNKVFTYVVGWDRPRFGTEYSPKCVGWRHMSVLIMKNNAVIFGGQISSS